MPIIGPVLLGLPITIDNDLVGAFFGPLEKNSL